MNALLHLKYDNKDEANTATVLTSDISSSGVATAYEFHPGVVIKPSDEALKNAVFSYIKAVRALGQQHVNTADIARALDIRRQDVEKVVDSLAGVRRVR